MAIKHDDGTVLMRQEQKLKPPSMYQVLLLNDDYTPMEFVVMILQEYFSKDRETATQIMLMVHRDGKGICGVYPKDIASTKVELVLNHARKAGHLACKEARDEADSDAYFYKNEEFHQQIYIGSKNAFLEEQARALQRRLRPYRRLQLRVRNRVTASFDEHGAVVDAIIAGKGEHAAELLRQHIMIQGQRFSDLVASLSALTSEA